jgi:hypothetical protein
VTCSSCGQENPPNLVFCQTCGHRLAPRMVPPTPPIGLPFDFAQAAAAIPVREQSPSGPTLATGTCPNCAAANQAHIRFCLTCGTRLIPSMPPPGSPTGINNTPGFGTQNLAGTLPVPSAQHVAAGPLFGVTAPPAATPSNIPPPVPVSAQGSPPRKPAPMIAPTPSVLITGPAAAIVPSMTARVPAMNAAPSATHERKCPRCEGLSDGRAQFCRFCGAPMTGSTATDPAPAHTAPPLVAKAVVAPAAAAVVPAETAVFARVIVVTKDGGEGAQFPITERVDMGRTEGEVRFPDDGYLSTRHVRLTVRQQKLYLRDLGTPNGVYLRVKTNEEVPIAGNGLVLIGQQVLRVEPLFVETLAAVVEGDAQLFGTPSVPKFGRLCQRSVEGTKLCWDASLVILSSQTIPSFPDATQ